jgi:hypothetical protein
VRKADQIAVRHRHGDIVAVVEVVSPGHKASAYALRAFVEKGARYIGDEVHRLVIDLFAPSRRDPQGIHKAIWDCFIEEDFELPADKPLTLVAYEAAPEPVAYVEPVAVGDRLPDMPIFLKPRYYVPAPPGEILSKDLGRILPGSVPAAARAAGGGRERSMTGPIGPGPGPLGRRGREDFAARSLAEIEADPT